MQFKTVLKIIFMSRDKLQFSRYQVSYSTRFFISESSFVSPRRPFTWAYPVIPELMKWRTLKFSMISEYSSVCFNICGRGPTTDISPRNTLKNCGSSSMLVLRNMLPTRVIRESFFSACLAFASSFTRMVRNL